MLENASETEQLPDKPGSKESTGLLQRTNDRRRANHLELLGKLHCQLDYIAQSCERSLSDVLYPLQTNTSESIGRISDWLAEVDPEKQFDTVRYESYDQALDDALEQVQQWQKDVKTSKRVTGDVEKRRLEDISEAFSVIVPLMMRLSHLKPDDVRQAMEEEFIVVSHVVLQNRRFAQELLERLGAEALFQEKRCRVLLNEFRQHWQKLALEKAVTGAAFELEYVVQVCLEGLPRHHKEFKKEVARTRERLSAKCQEVIKVVPPNMAVDTLRTWLLEARQTVDEASEAAMFVLERMQGKVDKAILLHCLSLETHTERLQQDLRLPEAEVRKSFLVRALHNVAQQQSWINNDFQMFSAQVGRSRSHELDCLNAFFASLHGAVWHWELHLTCTAKAEQFLDSMLQKQRVAFQTMIESKLQPKLRTILEALRHSFSPSTTASQLHAFETALAEVDKQLKETWKKMYKVLDNGAVLMKILLRGYQERIFAYFQVSLQKPTSNALPNKDGRSSQVPTVEIMNATNQPTADHSSGGRKLPDIPVDAAERAIVKELGLLLVDEENLGLRSKCLPPYSDDPRGAPPRHNITTPKGLVLIPAPTDLQSTVRFAREKDLGKMAELQPRMTESQAAVMDDFPGELAVPSGMVVLHGLLEFLPLPAQVVEVYAALYDRWRTAVLTHAVDEWEDIFLVRVQSYLDSRKELCETEIQLQLRGCTMRLNTFAHQVVAVREMEIKERDEAYKKVEVSVLDAYTSLKADIASCTKQVIEKMAPVRDGLSVIEKAFALATAKSGIDQLRRQLKAESAGFAILVKSMFQLVKDAIKMKYELLRAECKSDRESNKLAEDGGTYNQEDFHHYNQLWQKLADKSNSNEKSLNDECRVAEQRRRQFFETIVIKAAEKSPHHEADLNFISALANILEKTQLAVKHEAGLINEKYVDAEKGLEAILSGTTVKGNDQSGHPDKLLITLDLTVQKFHSCCTKLDCIVDLKEPKTPPLSPDTTVSTARVPSRMNPRKSSPAANQSVLRQPVNPPADFQLTAPDGPVTLVQPKPFIPVDVKVATSSRGMGTKTPEHKSARKGKSAASSRDAATPTGGKKANRLDKYMIFPEHPKHGEMTFAQSVGAICWTALNSALALGEDYYKARGARSVTRPALIPDNIDLFAERVCRKLLNYQTQSEQYASHLTDKIAQQATLIINLAPKVISEILGSCLKAYQQELSLQKRLIGTVFELGSKHVHDDRESVDEERYPTDVVRENDKIRMMEILCDRTQDTWRAAITASSTEFMSNLNRIAMSLFRICDGIFIPQEIKQYKTVQPVDMAQPEAPSVPFDLAGRTWSPLNLEVRGSVNVAKLVCQRTTPAHLAVDDARRDVFDRFMHLREQFLGSASRWIAPAQKDQTERKKFQEIQLKKLEALGFIGTYPEPRPVTDAT